MQLKWCIHTSKGIPTVTKIAAAIFKKCAPFVDSITEIYNTEIDNAKDIDVLMSMNNFKEFSDNYSKTYGSLW